MQLTLEYGSSSRSIRYLYSAGFRIFFSANDGLGGKVIMSQILLAMSYM